MSIVCQFWHIPWPNPEAFRDLPLGRRDPRRPARQRLAGLPHPVPLQQFPRHGGCARSKRASTHEQFAVVRRRPSRPTSSRFRSASIPSRGRDRPRAVRGRPTSRADAAIARPGRASGIIFGVDRLDYTKGIPERIQAFERMLERHPEWRERVTMLQVGAPSREQPAALPERSATKSMWPSRRHQRPVRHRRLAAGRSTCAQHHETGRTSPRSIAPPTSAWSRRCTTA